MVGVAERERGTTGRSGHSSASFALFVTAFAVCIAASIVFVFQKRPKGETLGDNEIRAIVTQVVEPADATYSFVPLLSRLTALNRRDNPNLANVATALCERSITGSDVITPQVRSLITWVCAVEARDCIKTQLEKCVGVNDTKAAMLLEILRRIGTDADIDFISRVSRNDRLRELAPLFEEAAADLRVVRESRALSPGHGEVNLPSFLTYRPGSHALIYHGIRYLREWPRSDTDVVVRDRVCRELIATPSSQMSELMTALSESIVLAVEAYPGKSDLEHAGGSLFLSDQYTADSGGCILDGIQHSYPDALYSCLAQLIDAPKLGTLMIGIQDSVIGEKLGSSAIVLYSSLLSRIDEFEQPSHLVAAATWIVRTTRWIDEKDPKELRLFGRLDYSHLVETRDPRIRELIQYLSWRLPTQVAPILAQFSRYDQKSEVSSKLLTEIQAALSRWGECKGYDRESKKFVFPN